MQLIFTPHAVGCCCGENTTHAAVYPPAQRPGWGGAGRDRVNLLLVSNSGAAARRGRRRPLSNARTGANARIARPLSGRPSALRRVARSGSATSATSPTAQPSPNGPSTSPTAARARAAAARGHGKGKGGSSSGGKGSGKGSLGSGDKARREAARQGTSGEMSEAREASRSETAREARAEARAEAGKAQANRRSKEARKRKREAAAEEGSRAAAGER